MPKYRLVCPDCGQSEFTRIYQGITLFEGIESIFFDDDDEKLKQHMLIGSNLRHYYEGKTNGILEVVDIISKHLGKPIRDDETIEEYYKRWLFGYE